LHLWYQHSISAHVSTVSLPRLQVKTHGGKSVYIYCVCVCVYVYVYVMCMCMCMCVCMYVYEFFDVK